MKIHAAFEKEHSGQFFLNILNLDFVFTAVLSTFKIKKKGTFYNFYNKQFMRKFIGAAVTLSLALTLTPLSAQEEKEPKFGISFSGFVKNDFFLDTRQTESAREGQFLFWPAPVNEDFDGDDINAKAQYNFLAVQTRLSGKITGPDAFGAKTSGIIEGDFFAQANDNINLFRMRHALIRLNWENTEILTGQYWNPLFITDCFPNTVSFNSGVPMQSFARNPQLRITHTRNTFSFIAAMLGQRDHASRGPNGPSPDYLRNAVIPDLHAQVHYIQEGLLFGVGAAYKRIVPRLVTTGMQPEKTTEGVSGLTLIAFGKVTTSPVTIKLQGRYGENISDVLSISGFALQEVVDPLTGEYSYTPLTNVTVWGEVETNGSKFQVGIFGGYLENLGTKDVLSSPSNPVYGFGTNIASLLRVSPRIIFNSGKFRVAGELEYTQAAFGSDFDNHYVAQTTETVSNTRILISSYLFF